MKISELALLKIMHQRISPTTTGMEHYSRAFSALLLIEQANVRDLCRLTELDSQSISHLLKNLEKAEIIRPLQGNRKGDFAINLEPERLFELIETQQKEFSWIVNRNKKEETRKNCQPLACTSAARY